MKTFSLVTAILTLLTFTLDAAAESPQGRVPVAPPSFLLKQSKTTVFLGDSITAAGQYIGLVETWLLTQKLERLPHVIDAGLASETVSGLSEDGHAGGKFPRPDLAERIDRVLAATKPDLVFACYGINCGIYLPFDEARFKAYQDGYRQLKAKIEAAGAKLVIITPPFYDDLRSPKNGFSYNEVLDKYSAWLVEQRKEGWLVIDLHSAMSAEVRKRRETDPKYTMQPDGVHPNADGHWCVARHLIKGLDGDIAVDAAPADLLSAAKIPAEVLPLVQQRMGILRDSYVATAGHKRPGVAKGMPIEEAEKKAAELTAKIKSLVEASK